MVSKVKGVQRLTIPEVKGHGQGGLEVAVGVA